MARIVTVSLTASGFAADDRYISPAIARALAQVAMTPHLRYGALPRDCHYIGVIDPLPGPPDGGPVPVLVKHRATVDRGDYLLGHLAVTRLDELRTNPEYVAQRRRMDAGVRWW